ncbi:MAG TPA: hypothetical protein VF306_08465 [Pirellulales bacterium]
MFDAGDCYWATINRHWYFIISDPRQNPSQIVQVNTTTLIPDAGSHDPYNDRSCILYAGEHPTITHTSCIYYWGTQIGSINDLARRLERHEIKPGDPASPEMLEKMRQGALITEHIIPLAADILIEQGLV